MAASVAVLGGSFDPLHLGHLALVKAALEQIKPDCLLLLPCATPPHKANLVSSAEMRLAMLQAAVTELADSRLEIDVREFEREGASYSLLSLQELRAKYGKACSLNFIIGWDSLQSLDRWFQWRELFALCNFVIAKRPGYTELESAEIRKEKQQREVEAAQLNQHSAGAMAELPMPAWPISSSELRAALRAHCDDSYLRKFISPAVLDLIRKQALYSA
ncbi:nicotinate (nicotinamide) nucleotide adenylyltransferase [Agaribacterium sp. ZY112]|uniref:nicotinate (nicotinamide) nucleotide adenylyltransferase n=1 Tax=Agaribacterium sp. ZY112 TaxID=3233574 RepID=UPI00352503E1